MTPYDQGYWASHEPFRGAEYSAYVGLFRGSLLDFDDHWALYCAGGEL